MTRGDHWRDTGSGGRGYLLRRCEGYRVLEEGRTVGRVACVRYLSDPELPAQIVVGSGLLRRRLRAVDVADVGDISAERRVITLRGPTPAAEAGTAAEPPGQPL